MKKSTFYFSIIELMTVILIILLLLSLFLPLISNTKRSARTTVCKSQLRQVGVLIVSYSSDNGGYLPNSNKTDRYPLPPTFSNDLDLYANWNGHLLPYLDENRKSYYKTCAVDVKTGNIKTHNGGGTWYETKNIAESVKVNPLAGSEGGGWDIVSNALKNGGHDSLKVFICPEIYNNVHDVGASRAFNDIRLPRINHLCSTYIGFPGIPSTYYANELFFGADLPWKKNSNSFRIDEINSISSKGLLVEGGIAYAQPSNGEPEVSYYAEHYGDLFSININKNNTAGHRMNYVHDSNEVFWLLNRGTNHIGLEREAANLMIITSQFNELFKGRAYMMQEGWGYCIYSLVNPSSFNGSSELNKFLISNKLQPVTSNNFVEFYEPEFQYLTGKMNILFGDNSVELKDHGWLSMNRKLLSENTIQ